MAWFAGFVPAENPRYAFAALYEGSPGETLSGGRKAPPMISSFFNKFYGGGMHQRHERDVADRHELSSLAELGVRPLVRSAGGDGNSRYSIRVRGEQGTSGRSTVPVSEPVKVPTISGPKRRGLFRR